MTRLLLPVLLCLATVAMPARAQPDPTRGVGFEQLLGAPLPQQAVLRDEAGRPVRLGDYFGARPVVLVLGYYECPNLCGLVMNGLLRSLREISFDAGEQFEVVALSIDPREGPTLAAAKKRSYLREYARDGAAGGWHFLTGGADAIEQVAGAVGFHYRYDEDVDQFAHAAGVIVATPDGRISRYLFGIDFPPRDLRLALVEASGNVIGNLSDRLWLLCCAYDPRTGRYGFFISNTLRAAAIGTALLLAALVLWLLRREQHATRLDRAGRHRRGAP